METRSSITNAMVPIWIYLAIVLGARFNHRIDHFSRVLPMHVVVSGTMNQQVIAFNPVREIQRRVVFIAQRIVDGSAQISLSINIVVKFPMRNRCDCHCGLEHTAMFGNCAAAHISTEAPTPNTDSAGINVGECRHLFCGISVICAFQ